MGGASRASLHSITGDRSSRQGSGEIRLDKAYSHVAVCQGADHVKYNWVVAHGCMTEDGEPPYDAENWAPITLGLNQPSNGWPNFQLQGGVGLLPDFDGFAHNDFCLGFFSGSPPNLTRNNHNVRHGWSLVGHRFDGALGHHGDPGDQVDLRDVAGARSGRWDKRGYPADIGGGGAWRVLASGCAGW